MAETKKDIKNQIDYMNTNKTKYLENITIEEYKKRIELLKADYNHAVLNCHE